MGNYMYRKKSQRNNYSFWQCVVANCKARGNLYGNSGAFTISNEHSHEPQPQALALRRHRAELASMASHSIVPADYLVSTLHVPDDQVTSLVNYAKYVQVKSGHIKKRPLKKQAMLRVGHDYDVLPTHRDKAAIVRDGFVFRQYRGRPSDDRLGAIYWRCVEKNCDVMGKTSATGVLDISSSEHNHPALAVAMADWEDRNKLKEAAEDTTRPIVEIYADFNVQDAMTRRYLKYIREQKLKEEDEQRGSLTKSEVLPETKRSLTKSEVLPETKKTEDPAAAEAAEVLTATQNIGPLVDTFASEMVPEILDLSISDINDPTPLVGFERVTLDESPTGLSVRTNDPYNIEELFDMNDTILE